MRIGTAEVNARISFVESIVSAVTGRELARYDAEFMVSRQEMPTSEEIRAARIVLENGRVCCVDGWSTSDVGGTIHCNLHLQEVEELAPASVVVGQTVLKPVQYEETVSTDGDRDVRLIAPCTMDEVKALWHLSREREALTVSRPDIVDEDASLSLKNLLYSKEPEGVFVALHLGPEPDDKTVPWLAGLGNAVRMAAGSRARTKALMELLVAKGVLSDEEAEAINNADDQFQESLLLLDEASDLSSRKL